MRNVTRSDLHDDVNDDGQMVRADRRAAPEILDAYSGAYQRMINLDAGGRQKSGPCQLPAKTLRCGFQVAHGKELLKMRREGRDIQVAQHDERLRLAMRELTDHDQLPIAQS